MKAPLEILYLWVIILRSGKPPLSLSLGVQDESTVH